MSVIKYDELNKWYGSTHVVKDLNLEIAEHEFVVLVGPSGCGKSTTLRMTAGLEEVSTGEISIAGRVVNSLPPKSRDIGMVFQNYALYQHMNVYDNLAFGLRNRNVSESQVSAKVAEIARALDIEPLLKRTPKQLSGGQQQRVALGRCLVRDPAIFLFDEPLSNLDTLLRAKMRQELKRLRTQFPVTSLYVTHDQTEAMTLCDRMVVMKDGVVQQVGSPLEVYNRPANKFVAEFIGSPGINMLDGSYVREGELSGIQNGAWSLAFDAAETRAIPQDGKISVGIRPEDLKVVDDSYSGDKFTGKVDFVECLGPELLAAVRVGDSLLEVSQLPPSMNLQRGDAVKLAVEPSKLHLFSSASGARLS